MAPTKVLTRSIFRAIVANRPFTFAGCHQLIVQHHRPLQQPWHPSTQQRRRIFGIGIGATPRSLREGRDTPVNLELALGQMVDLMRARRSQSKPPHPEKVADALNYLFRSRLETPRRFTRNEVYLATESVKHLQEMKMRAGDDGGNFMSEEDLYTALASLAAASGREKFRSDSKLLAYLLFQEIRRQSSSESQEMAVDEDGSQLGTYITILSRTGDAREAQELLSKSKYAQSNESMVTWVSVIKGLATEGLEKEALALAEVMQGILGPMDPSTHEDLVVFLAGEDKVILAKALYKMKLADGSSPSNGSKIAVVKFCIRNNEFEWGEPIFDSLPTVADTLDAENTFLLWHAAKGVDFTQIRNLLNKPLTIENINGLLEHAYSTGKQDLARGLLSYINTNDLRPNAKTYVVQLDHQQSSGALQAAVSTFNQLACEDTPPDNSDLPVLNRLLAALCFAPTQDYEVIMRIVDGLLDRGAEIDAESLAGLCHVFLERDELQQILGLLRHRVDSYPTADRARVAAIFREFIVDLKVDDQRAFNAYELFRHAFPETPVSQRLPLMNSFFNRKRPDLGCLVFGHMRQREDPEARPTAEAYDQCFEGIARCRDIDGLQMIYNMLKLDLEVEQTTRIHHGLMAANIACQMADRAIIDHFWKIMDSREGPTMGSFALALRACETFVPQGAQEARRIIAMMQAGGIEISREIYHCYIGALAGNSEFENAIELIEEMENDIDERPDAITIGTFYNAIPYQYRKDEVERWAKQAYPDLWEELLTYGDDIDEEWEMRTFRIPRDIDMDDEALFGQGEYSPQLAQETQYLLEESNV